MGVGVGGLGKEVVVEIRERLRCRFIRQRFSLVSPFFFFCGENKSSFASDRPAWVGLVKDALGCVCVCVGGRDKGRESRQVDGDG